MNRAWQHFKTITHHKYLVAKGCFAVGLYKQGILHDLSKYGPTEFLMGVKYFQGDRSPHLAEREDKGYSYAWMHHKGRNKHHFEFWSDYSLEASTRKLVPMPMPDRYVAEMIMDRIAASKVYMGENYTDASALEYFNRGTDTDSMHEVTKKKLQEMLTYLAKEGEEKTYRRIREELVRTKPDKETAKAYSNKHNSRTT